MRCCRETTREGAHMQWVTHSNSATSLSRFGSFLHFLFLSRRPPRSCLASLAAACFWRSALSSRLHGPPFATTAPTPAHASLIFPGMKTILCNPPSASSEMNHPRWMPRLICYRWRGAGEPGERRRPRLLCSAPPPNTLQSGSPQAPVEKPDWQARAPASTRGGAYAPQAKVFFALISSWKLIGIRRDLGFTSWVVLLALAARVVIPRHEQRGPSTMRRRCRDRRGRNCPAKPASRPAHGAGLDRQDREVPRTPPPARYRQ